MERVRKDVGDGVGEALAPLGRATAAWFARAFGAATPVQARGWAAIARGEDALLIAPTGSGKTLAAFLVAIDRLASAPADDGVKPVEGWRALYVSPLKALVYDVERNLGSPLAGIEVVARQLGLPFRPLTIDVRTGDTTAKERRRQVERPGDILVTTPESLYLLLTSAGPRQHLKSVKTLIIDEIHAIAPTKRGAHMMLSVERLAELTSAPLQRIGLSATVRPAEEIAHFLSGPRACAIVDTAAPPRLDLQVLVPVEDMRKPYLGAGEDFDGEGPGALGEKKSGPLLAPTPQERTSLWPAIEPKILELILQHRSTIVFVNSRGLAERLAARLNELAAEVMEAADEGTGEAVALVRAHHGSVAHAQRREMEEALKHGKLRAIVATSSLELGIDMGAVDLVIQVESPDSSARGLQRVGRAGHQVGGTSRGRIFPKHRNDLLEAAVVSRMMLDGHIEALTIPKNPLDVLAQQIVAMCAVGPQLRGELLALVRRCWNFRDITDDVFDGVLEMLAGRFPSSDVADLRPRLNWDRANDRLEARKGARLLATVNGGTIPDRGLYGVFAQGEGDKMSRVGELDEEMVHEARVGETFLLGASSWRIQEITRDRVIVTPAPGEPGKMPFWHGEGPGRPIETGRVLGAFTAHIAELGKDEADRWLALNYPLDRRARKNLVEHIAEQREATGLVPSDRTIVVERFKDEVGDFRVCILTPFGARVHAPWALALEEVLGQRSGLEVQALWTDDGIALRFADSDSGPSWDQLWIEPEEIEDRIVERLGTSAMFSGSFRENAARALLLPRRSPEGRAPLWQQRLRAQSLLAAVRQHPGFPIILETYRSCLQDQFDVPALKGVLGSIVRREVRVHEVETRLASPFSRSLAFAYVAQYMYEYDNPVAERRAHALTLDRDLLRELLGEGELRTLLSDEVLAEVEDELQARVAPYKANSADRLHDLLRRLGALDDAAIGERVEVADGGAAKTLLKALGDARRVVRMRIAGRAQWVAIEDAALYRDGLGVAVPGGIPAVFLTKFEGALDALIMRYARSHGPFLVAEVAAYLGLPVDALTASVVLLGRLGKLSEGAYRPRGTSREWCEPEVLRRIRRRMLASLRKEVAAVDAATFSRFLVDWHGIGDARGASGVVRLIEVIAQLEGLPIALSELESRVLPARVRGYHTRMLDEVMGTGEVVWVGAGALGTKDGRVCLYRRAQAVELIAVPLVPEGTGALHLALLALFAARGAIFFSEMLTRLDVTASHATVAEVIAALWDLVWMGLVTNDTLAPVRAFGGGAGTSAKAGVGSRALSSGGRWSLVSLLAGPDVPTKRRLARVTSLLERWGLIGRSVVDAEGAFEGEGGFAGLYDTLRAMEDVGKVRRGHFIDGLVGSQLALPGVVDRLRAARAPRDGAAIVLAATDPANPWGGLFAWPLAEVLDAEGRVVPAKLEPRRKIGAMVVIADGLPLLWVAPGGKKLVTMSSAREDERQAVRALSAWGATGREGLTLVTEIDGVPVRSTRWEPLLREAGFAADYRGMVLSKKAVAAVPTKYTPAFAQALDAITRAPKSEPVSTWPVGPWSTPAELALHAQTESAPVVEAPRETSRFTFKRTRGK